MHIVDYFDPQNIDHIIAFQYRGKFGYWPDGFVPDGVMTEECDHTSISLRIAREWSENRIENYYHPLNGQIVF